MNKKQLITTLVILLCFPVFAQARIIRTHVSHNVNYSEFSTPDGVFSFKLPVTPQGEFTNQRLFSNESIFKNSHSRELRSPTGIFSTRNNDFRNSNSVFKVTKGEFSSAGLFSNSDLKEALKSKDKDAFKFSLPKTKETNKKLTQNRKGY
jgi:hypothetical protein